MLLLHIDRSYPLIDANSKRYLASLFEGGIVLDSKIYYQSRITDYCQDNRKTLLCPNYITNPYIFEALTDSIDQTTVVKGFFGSSKTFGSITLKVL